MNDVDDFVPAIIIGTVAAAPVVSSGSVLAGLDVTAGLAVADVSGLSGLSGLTVHTARKRDEPRRR